MSRGLNYVEGSGKRPQDSGMMKLVKEIQHHFNVEYEVDIPNIVAPEVAFPKFGAVSVCGRRKYMEDTVAIYPSFCQGANENSSTMADMHYFGVFDGHGCSHVASRCKEFLHVLVKEEMLNDNKNMSWIGWKWEEDMKRSFRRMDKEATTPDTSMSPNGGVDCRCKLHRPAFDAVGSAVIVAILTPNNIIISNCGDCRAVLCRNGRPIPLSFDHKPDRPDELCRIQAAGGHVISWNGPRVEGVLSMSRAIGDAYLKPYVSCEPEVTILGRTNDDEYMILASDGLWDVVSNETACDIVKTCFGLEEVRSTVAVGDETYDLTCFKVATLLTKLALARDSGDNVSVIIVDLKKD